MRFGVFIIGLVSVAIPAHATFIPMTLREKAREADLIVVGTAVSVTRLLPDETDGSVEADDAGYYGPASVAVIRVTEVWKRPRNHMRRFTHNPHKSVVPKYIMVPCDYSILESPSNLSADVKYVLFLRQLGSNFFHPLDPASTHVVADGRVANFGMNHPSTKKFEFPKRSTPIAEFKTTVQRLIESKKETVDESIRKPKTGV